MRRRRVPAVFGLSFFFASANSLAEAGASPQPAITIVVTAMPRSGKAIQLIDPRRPDAFSCSASFTVEGAPRFLSALDLEVKPGSSEQKSLESGEYVFTFAVSVPREGNRVESEVVIRQGSRVVSKYRGITSFPLRGPLEPATVPAR